MLGLERSEQRSRFIGRESVIASLESLAKTARLITLLGAPGIGKTRVALELGARANRANPGSIRVVDAVGHESGESVAESLTESIGGELTSLGAVTVVIDNFDMGDRSCVSRWLGAAPELVLIVTTRTRLGRTGEVLFEIPPLELSEAASLFLDRARNARPDASFDAEERALIDEIVTVLDGMPLAIELAANRLRVMGVAELRARLDDPLSLLVDGARKDRGRHQTLAGAIESSWLRLGESDRQGLARLAQFTEPFTLAAAESALGGDGALDRVQSLRDQSLLIRDADGRLRLLAPVATYVRKKSELGVSRAPSASPTNVVLEVARDGRGLRPPGADWITLPRGSPLGRILLRLVESRREQPGSAVSLDELVRVGWPGERMLPDAARNRAYMAMSRLRKLGLDALIVRTEDGYRIPSKVDVEYAEMPRSE